MLWQTLQFLLHQPYGASLSWSRPFSAAISAEIGVIKKLPVRFHADKSTTKEVDKVTIPATTGQMDILPGHMDTIAELKPGVMSIYEGNSISKYFLCGGFAFVYLDCIADDMSKKDYIADILAFGVTPLDYVDPNLVRQCLVKSVKMLKKTTEVEEVQSLITGFSVLTALYAAVSGKSSKS